MSLWTNTIRAKEKALGRCLGLLCFLLRGVTLTIPKACACVPWCEDGSVPRADGVAAIPNGDGPERTGRSCGGEERGRACWWIKVNREEKLTPHSCCSSNVLFPALCKPGLTCRQQKMSNNKRSP